MSTPEDLYKEKFSGYTPEPPQSIWSGIESRMPRQGFMRFSLRTFNIYYAAAVCGIAVWLGYGAVSAPEYDTAISAPYHSAAHLSNPAERIPADTYQLPAHTYPAAGAMQDRGEENITASADIQEHTAPSSDSSSGRTQPAETAPTYTESAAQPQYQAPEPAQQTAANTQETPAAPSTEIAYTAKGLIAVMEARTQGPALSYSWHLGDGTRAVGRRVQHKYANAGTYNVRLVAFSALADVHDTIYQEITIAGNEYQLKFPNAVVASTSGVPFAPKGNVGEVSKYRLVIYNRAGKEVFASSNPQEGWNGYYNGERAPKGVYAYRASYEFCNGEQGSDNGSVTVFWDLNGSLIIHP